ncbi:MULTISPECIES: hypothetical protein [Streptomyces]|uniref:hypothetical protein n=1 Tax=Streptomyces TaxID=1883 RepID=UPI002252BE61|nr:MULTISPECIES: hypothetical protein [Streptomyces]MCX5275356.1 hypothetical protein [Streptomyces virginiae]MCX5582967.1 hypothetical protein [Streptomyces erythrochromogenes]
MPDSNQPPLENPGLADGIDVIIQDLRSRPFNIDHATVTTVIRHISQVSALLTQVTGEAHAHSDHARRHPEPSLWRPTHLLSLASIQLAEALSSYTKILAPLTIACEPTPYGTVDDAMDRIDCYEAMEEHLPAIGRALTEAHDHVKPDAPTPPPPAAPNPPTKAAAIEDSPDRPVSSPAAPITHHSPQSPAPEALPKLNDTQHRALQTIGEHEIVVYLRKHKLALSGQSDSRRFTMRTVEALEAKHLVARSFATTLAMGQRLHLTPSGKQLLDSLGRAPLPPPASSPVRPIRPPSARTR